MTLQQLIANTGNYMWVDVTEKNKDQFNQVVSHPLQSYEWGEFRKTTGIKVIRRSLVENGKIKDGFTLTIHKVPKTKFTIGYLPKGNKPNKELLKELERIGKEEKCIFIQLEPNIIEIENLNLRPSFHPLFTKFTFILDIDKAEEELLKNMHPKTRYNIKVAQKHNVNVYEDNSENAFKEYQKLTQETTNRQKFYAHTPSYHQKMWNTLKITTEKNPNSLTAHLLKAEYKNETLATWVLFIFHKTLYYPYGASSSKHRNVMASNLIMWEAIKFGKKHKLQKFDMWGALGNDPNHNDPWYGFHKFKEGYGAELTEFAGSYDLVINPTLYQLYKLADRTRWAYLRLRKFI